MVQRFETFTVLINRISRNIRKIKNEEMAEYKLRSVHTSCLYYLYKEESLSLGELCNICEEDKANISRSLSYLEKEGYITSSTKRRRRYHLILELTDKGREVAKKLVLKIDSMLERASDGLSEEDRIIMYRSLALISSNLQKIYENYENTDDEDEGSEEEE